MCVILFPFRREGRLSEPKVVRKERRRSSVDGSAVVSSRRRRGPVRIAGPDILVRHGCRRYPSRSSVSCSRTDVSFHRRSRLGMTRQLLAVSRPIDDERNLMRVRLVTGRESRHCGGPQRSPPQMARTPTAAALSWRFQGRSSGQLLRVPNTQYSPRSGPTDEWSFGHLRKGRSSSVEVSKLVRAFRYKHGYGAFDDARRVRRQPKCCDSGGYESPRSEIATLCPHSRNTSRSWLQEDA